MNKSKKPSWNDAPLDANLLVGHKYGIWYWGTFEKAKINASDDGWVGSGNGMWKKAGEFKINQNWRETLEFKPVIDTNINHVTTTNLSEESEEMAEKDPSGLSANTAGAKLDAGKVRPDLILSGMPRALLAVADVGTFGANKYSENGWLSVPDGIKRYTAAMDRHRLKESIEPTDPDSELLHAAHLAWNALARLELMLRDK